MDRRRALSIFVVWSLAITFAGAATPLFVTPDVPTVTSGGVELLPWQIFRYDAAGANYTLELNVPGTPALDAIHKLDEPGGWLLSVESANDLGGLLGMPALPADVIRRHGSGLYDLFFCGAALGISSDVNLDALYLAGGDAGSLVASFDIPFEFPSGSGTFYDPADLLRFARTSGGGCADWSIAGFALDASAAGSGIAAANNVVAADFRGGFALALDTPSDLAPTSGPTTYVPGHVVSWNGVTFGLFEQLAGWPAGSVVDGLSGQANPGRIDPTIEPLRLGKAPGGQLVLTWSASCSSGADDFGIYEGTLVSIDNGIYDHVRIDCHDAAPALSETITPGAASQYYLIVPYNPQGEGSYGVTSAPSVERPQAVGPLDRCSVAQILTGCP